MNRVVILFDIDGTLLDTGGAGLGALKEGFFDAFPNHHPSGDKFPELDLAGATDGGVAISIFRQFGIPDTGENRVRFFECYALRLSTALKRDATGKARILDGARELLDCLRTSGEYSLGLLTGNTAKGARIKVEHFGISDFFRFGAFGDDHHDRNALGPIAMERARKTEGHHVKPENVVVIGDTPKDIACARACGARVIAVASGSCSRENLESHNPDFLFDNLIQTSEILTAIENHQGRSTKAR